MFGRQLELIDENLTKNRISLPIYFISINPKSDSFKKQKNFLNKFVSGSRWNFLTATESTTRKLLAELEMGFSDIRTGAHVTHTMSLAVLNSDGEILGLIPVVSDNPEIASDKIQASLQKKLPSSK